MSELQPSAPASGLVDLLLRHMSLPNGMDIWIITEADRSATTILLPGEH